MQIYDAKSVIYFVYIQKTRLERCPKRFVSNPSRPLINMMSH